MEGGEQIDKPLRDLIEIIHFTETVSAKVHGVLDEAEICRIIKEEFAKSKRYTASILLLTDDGSKLRIAETSLAPGKLKAGEKALGMRLKEYKIDLNKSSIYSRVVREGKTVQVSVSETIGELFPRPLDYLISKIMDYEKKKSILTPLKRHGKIIGAFGMSSTDLAEYFIPSVRNLAHHISTALELADERAECKKAEEALWESQEHGRFLGDVLERSSQPFAVGYPDGRLMTYNTAYCKLLGYSKEELDKLKWSTDLTPPEWRKVVAKAAEEIRRTGQPQRFEKEYIRKDGSRIPVEVFAHPVFDSKGNLKYYYSFFTDITERKKAGEQIKLYEKRLRSLASELTLVEERERRRIAADLHDSVSQLLTLGKIKLGQLEKVTPCPDSAALLEEIRDLLEQTIEYTRSLTFQLSPSVLHELGLEAALEWLAEYIYKQQGIQINLEVDSQTKPMDQELRVFLFRAVRELLMNVAKHAKTDRAKVSLSREGESIRINVEDAGVGFDTAIIEAPSDTDRGFGLFSILEHLRYLGGKLSIQSKPGQGTQVTLVAPLKGPQGKKPGRMR